jgi:hypothetical protein
MKCVELQWRNLWPSEKDQSLVQGARTGLFPVSSELPQLLISAAKAPDTSDLCLVPSCENNRRRSPLEEHKNCGSCRGLDHFFCDESGTGIGTAGAVIL